MRRQTLGIASNSEAHAGFFKSGANMAGVLTIEGARLNEGAEGAELQGVGSTDESGYR